MGFPFGISSIKGFKINFVILLLKFSEQQKSFIISQICYIQVHCVLALVVPTTAGEQKVIDTWDLTSLDGAWLPPIQVKCLGYS